MKLGDFGFAAFVSEHELLEGVVGTDGYVPPVCQAFSLVFAPDG